MDCPRCGAFNSMLAVECGDCSTRLCADPDVDAVVEAPTDDVARPETLDLEYDHRARHFRATIGQRVAGGLMLIPLITVGCLAAFAPASVAQLAPAHMVGIAVYVVVGAALLAGMRRLVQPIAVLVAVVGVVGTISHDPFDVVTLSATVPSAIALLLLLLGDASKLRILLGVGFFSVAVPAPWIAAKLVASLSPQTDDMLEPELDPPAHNLLGRALAYELALFGEGWRIRTEPAGDGAAAIADGVAVNINTGAFVRAYVKRSTGAEYDLSLVAERVIANATNKTSAPVVAGQIEPYRHRSRIVRVQLDDGGKSWHCLYGVAVGVGWALEIRACAPADHSMVREPDLRKILNSLRLPKDALGAPGGLRPISTKEQASLVFDLGENEWHEVDASTFAKRGLPVGTRAWALPHRSCTLLVQHERGAASGRTPRMLLDDWLRAVRKKSRIERVQFIDQQEPRRAAMVELSGMSGELKRFVWAAVIVRQNDVLMGVIEANERDHVELGGVARKTLRSLDFARK